MDVWEKPAVKHFNLNIKHCRVALIAPLGGAEQLLLQHLASGRGSEPQTLGKAALCPYKAAIHPLPSSSVFLRPEGYLQRECLGQPALPY